jgi:hypothetical protein
MLVVLAAAAAPLFLAATAASEVLVNVPLSRGCLGHSIDVGVWWKQTTPERSYRVEIRDPTSRLVFARAGEAPDRWLIWHYVPRRTGTFRVVCFPQTAYSTFRTVIGSTGCFSGNVAGAGTGPGHRFVVGDGLYLNFRDHFRLWDAISRLLGGDQRLGRALLGSPYERYRPLRPRLHSCATACGLVCRALVRAGTSRRVVELLQRSG